MPSGTLEIGITDNKPYGWIFSKQKTTFDPNEADIFPRFDQRFGVEQIILETSSNGGIAFTSVEELGMTSDLLVYTDIAPEQGYIRSVELNFSRGAEGPSGVYFVRTRDGNN